MVVAKKDNILAPCGTAIRSFETTVRAIVSLDLNQGQEKLSRRVDLDNISAFGDHAE